MYFLYASVSSPVIGYDKERNYITEFLWGFGELMQGKLSEQYCDHWIRVSYYYPVVEALFCCTEG